MVRKIKVFYARHLVSPTALAHHNAICVKTAVHDFLLVYAIDNFAEFYHCFSGKLYSLLTAIDQVLL